MARQPAEQPTRSPEAPVAWERVWGNHLAALQADDPSRAQVQSWWGRELQGLGRLGLVLEIGAGADATVATLVATEYPGTAVIASDYRPLAPTLARGIQRLENAPIESLPIPDAHVDVLVSQFAFEYADRARAVAEVARVLRPGGAARLLLHHADSFWSRKLVHRLRARQAAAALERTLVDPRLSATARPLKIRQCLVRLRELQQAQSRGKALPDVLADLQDLIDLAQRILANPAEPPPPADLELLAQCQPALLLTRLQMQATLTAADMTSLEQQFRAAGCRAAHDVLLNAQGQPLAWALRLQR